MRRFGLFAPLALSTLVGCGGCSPGYVLRAAYEESRILWSRRPIERVLEQGELDAQSREKLELAVKVREFAARELGLKTGRAYRSIAEVKQGALLFVVSAAERSQLKAYRWWFPIVGTVDYKGFFDRGQAEKEAARLEAAGYDTYLRTSSAFSTLGWFDDPILSSWLRYDPATIAELLIHELLHRTYYRNGQTTFNESMANFVGHRGAIAYFTHCCGADAEVTRRAEAAWSGEQAAGAAFAQAVPRLEALYAKRATEGTSDASDQKWLAARAEVLDELARELDEVPREARSGRGLANVKMNNAVVLAHRSYLTDLDRFEAVWRATGRDLHAAIERIRELTADAEDPFTALADAVPVTASGVAR